MESLSEEKKASRQRTDILVLCPEGKKETQNRQPQLGSKSEF